MCEDNDIKIAGEKIKTYNSKCSETPEIMPNANSIRRGTELGTRIAKEYLLALGDQGLGANDMSDEEDMLPQRKVLLSFAALSGFERFCDNNDYSSAAKSQFLAYIKNESREVWSTATDNGALSFYYLSFRRGGEVERRVGQTFAMLCSHDGDPVYQELGEALYCWFTSVVKRKIEELEN